MLITIRLLLTSFLFQLGWQASVFASPSAMLIVGVHGEGQTHVQAFYDGRDPKEITDFSGEYAYRDIIEQVLLIQALDKGGFKGQVSFVPVDFYGRRIKLMEQGSIHLTSTPFWLADLTSTQKSVHISLPLIRDGEFVAGLYVYDQKPELLTNQSLAQIRQLTAVSNKNWQTDWDALSKMNLRGLVHNGQFVAMTQMLVKGRVDFMLAPFYNSADLSFRQDGYRFVPIPNVKIALPGSRHFALSKHTPNADSVIKALNRGLTILRESGVIERAYQQSGFFNAQVKKWPSINVNN